MNRQLNDIEIVQVINEVKRPFQYFSMLDQEEPKKCGDCKHLERKEKIIDGYEEPFFICKVLNIEINWPYRDVKPNGCNEYVSK